MPPIQVFSYENYITAERRKISLGLFRLFRKVESKKGLVNVEVDAIKFILSESKRVFLKYLFGSE